MLHLWLALLLSVARADAPPPAPPPLRDQEVFQKAETHWSGGDRDEAVKWYTNLVRSYPESPLVPDAYYQLGEYYFDHNNAYKALLAYERATRYKDSDRYAFALYKLAWCFYNVGEYGKGIDTLKAAAQAAGQREGESYAALRGQALTDLVTFFADAGEIDQAEEYFAAQGEQALFVAVLQRLARTFTEQGRFEQAAQTYRRILAADPLAPDAPVQQYELVRLHQKLGQKAEARAESALLRETYGPGSAWARANEHDEAALQRAEEILRLASRRRLR